MKSCCRKGMRVFIISTADSSETQMFTFSNSSRIEISQGSSREELKKLWAWIVRRLMFFIIIAFFYTSTRECQWCQGFTIKVLTLAANDFHRHSQRLFESKEIEVLPECHNRTTVRFYDRNRERSNKVKRRREENNSRWSSGVGEREDIFTFWALCAAKYLGRK